MPSGVSWIVDSNMTDNASAVVLSEGPPSRMDITVITGEAFIMVVTLLGNSLVIAAIHRFPKLRSATNNLVYSLALSDIGVGLCLPFLIMFNLNPWLKTVKTACIIRYQVIITMGSVSQFTLVLVSVDRFVSIQFPLHYHRVVSTRRVTLALVAVWTYTFLFALLPVIGLNEWDPDSWARCEIENVLRASYVLAMTFHFFASAVVMVSLYGRIFCLARAHAKRMVAGVVARRGPKKLMSKATITLFPVLGVFIACWLPFYGVLATYETFRMFGSLTPERQRLLINIRLAMSVLGLSNSMWNPLIYAGKNRDFRLAFRKLLRGPGSSELFRRPTYVSTGAHSQVDDHQLSQI